MKKKLFSKILSIISILSLFLTLFFIVIFSTNISSLSVNLNTKEIKNKQSIIYDDNHHIIETLGKENTHVFFYEIPKITIDALLSIEDNEFYFHNGFNLKRIITSFVNNIFSSSLQGGSTLTQQLIKNTILNDEQSYSRKIKEVYLSYLLEQKYTKEEILELYFNNVYFEQSHVGLKEACKIFFNKDVSSLNYIESALLVGLVKSPSFYNPSKYPQRAQERKNLVLKAMKENKVITNEEYLLGINVNVESLLIKEEIPQETYKYQAYLDLVYEEIKSITGKDIYSYPLIVETYLDTSLQTYLDKIQDGNIYSFIDDNQQIGGAILDNEDAKIIGIIGGRNYKGKKVYNRAFHLKASPASSIKPLLSYALGIEYLSMHPLSTLIDEEYYYEGTSIKVNNADGKYLSRISLIEALGYSKNTCAVKTFDLLVKTLGKDKIYSYLKNINIMDEGTLTSSYSLGGMTYGVSPLQMAGGYCFIANKGEYITPSTIKKITSIDGKIIYERNIKKARILKEETCDKLIYSLKKVMEKNFLNINLAKPNNIDVVGKTGTNAYDKNTIYNNHLPLKADKDIWFCGFSPRYTISLWSGFDETNYNSNYFINGDSKKRVPKVLFNKIMTFIAKNEKFTFSNNLQEISIIKKQDELFLPNEFNLKSDIDQTLIEKDAKIEIFPSLEIENITKIELFNSCPLLYFKMSELSEEQKEFSYLYNDKGYLIEVINPNNEKKEYFTNETFFEFEMNEIGLYTFSFYIGFENGIKKSNIPYSFTIQNN